MINSHPPFYLLFSVVRMLLRRCIKAFILCQTFFLIFYGKNCTKCFLYKKSMFFISLGKHPTTCRGQYPPPHSRGEGTTIFPSTPAVWGAVMGSVSKRTFFDLFCQWNSFSPKKPPLFSSQPTCRKFDMSGFPIPPACLFLGIWKKNAVCFFEFEKKTREKPFYCQKNTCFPIPGGVGVPYACEMVQSWRVFFVFF